MSLCCSVLLIGCLSQLGFATPTTRRILASDSLERAAKGAQGDTEIQYCGKDQKAPIYTTGDPEVGPGFWITNNDGVKGDYFIYENSRDNHPWKYITIDNGARSFIQICSTFQGHVVRGTTATNLDNKVHNLSTWAVANVDAAGAVWGAISFLEGSDGGGSVRATDGTQQRRECVADVLDGAPAAALAPKGSGAMVLNKVVGEGASVDAMHWMLAKCSADQVYMEEPGPNPVIKSDNGRLEFIFSQGRF
ncbi:hypothetical protein LQW54_009575 [Pestalotiopsis sp. IQ-011]